MRYGIREICNIVLKAKSDVKIGNTEFKKGQPVLYIDTAKTSTMEGNATTVYATGGRGNTRLIAWEGEKTLTFTFEDALLSPISFAVLSGAGLFKGKGDTETVHVHMTSNAYASSTDGTIDLSEVLSENDKIDDDAPVFIVETESDGSLNGTMYTDATIADDGKSITCEDAKGKNVFVDFYVTRKSSSVSELQIDGENFAGYYYLEANTYFRKQIDGVDAPVEITIPNMKIQSNFNFSMAATGDPSTFTFTADAFPGYTYFDKTRKVLCVMQIIEDDYVAPDTHSVMRHENADGDSMKDGYSINSVETDPESTRLKDSTNSYFPKD